MSGEKARPVIVDDADCSGKVSVLGVSFEDTTGTAEGDQETLGFNHSMDENLEVQRPSSSGIMRKLTLLATKEGRGIGQGGGDAVNEGGSYTFHAGDRTWATPESLADAGATGETSPGTFTSAYLGEGALRTYPGEMIALANKQPFKSMDDEAHGNDEEEGHEGTTDASFISLASDTAAASCAPSVMIDDHNAVLECDVVATMHNTKEALAASRGCQDGKESTSYTGDPGAMKTATTSAMWQPVDTGFDSAGGSVGDSCAKDGKIRYDPHPVHGIPHVQSPNRMEHQPNRNRQEQLMSVNGGSCVKFGLSSTAKANAATERCIEGGQVHGEDNRVAAEMVAEGSEIRQKDGVGEGEGGKKEITGTSSSLARAACTPACSSRRDGQAWTPSATDSMIPSDTASGNVPAEAVSNSGRYSRKTNSKSARAVIAKLDDSPQISLGHSSVSRGALPVGVQAKPSTVKSRGVDRQRERVQGWKAGQGVNETFATLEAVKSVVGAERNCQSFEEIGPVVMESMAVITPCSGRHGLLRVGWEGSSSTDTRSCNAARGAPPAQSSDGIAGTELAVSAAGTGLRSSASVGRTSNISVVSETSGESRDTAADAMVAATIPSPAFTPSVGRLSSQSHGIPPCRTGAARTTGRALAPSMLCLSSKMESLSTTDFEGSGDKSALRSTDFAQLAVTTSDSVYKTHPSCAATAADAGAPRSDYAEARAIGEGGGGQVGSLHERSAPRDSGSSTSNNSKKWSSYTSGFLVEPFRCASITGGTRVNAKIPSVTPVPRPSRAMPESDELLGYNQNQDCDNWCVEGFRGRSTPFSGLEPAKYSRTTERPSQDEGYKGNSGMGVCSDAGLSAGTPPPRDKKELEVLGDEEEIFETRFESRIEDTGAAAQDYVDRGYSEDKGDEESSEDERYNCLVKTDHYGFFVTSERRGLDIPIEVSRMRRLQEYKREDKWRKMMDNFDEWRRGRKASKLRDRVRKGVPDCVRGKVWQMMMGSMTMMEKEPSKYADLLASDLPVEGPIDEDIPRTMYDHEMFCRKSKVNGRSMLRRVLTAYGRYDRQVSLTVDCQLLYKRHRYHHKDDLQLPFLRDLHLKQLLEVQYCQGINYICALFLLYMPEENAFWLLVASMHRPRAPLRELFLPGMVKAQEFQFVVDSLTKKYCNILSAQILANNLTPAMYATQWFLTAFTQRFPYDLVTRVWDIFLLEDWKVFYRVCLALFKSVEGEAGELDLENMNLLLRNMPPKVDAEEILRVAAAIPLKHRHIEKRIALFYSQMAVEEGGEGTN